MAEPFLFVSHVAEDYASAVELVAELERRSVRCWIAPRDVGPGKPYDDEIAAAIDDCVAMLLIFSERCNESDYIRREITVAGEARKLIIPFRIEDAKPKRGLRVRLADLHWIDGFIARQQAIDTLLATFARTQSPAPAPGGSATVAPATTPQPASPPPLPIDPAEEQQFRTYLTAAEQGGDPGYQYLVGRAYDSGRGVARDDKKAVDWFRVAAERGHTESVIELGRLSEQGRGVPMDQAQAIALFRKAAAKGNARAEWMLGCRYEIGQGLPLDYAAAAEWYRKAVARGYPFAQYSLGSLYESGRGVEKDVGRAIVLYRQAAAQNENNAKEALKRLEATD